jgi:uncharacterized membrane protein YphA (DoxX/SURF4 family)
MKNRILTEGIAIAFIFLFTYAGISKLTDVPKFTRQIGQSPILTDIAGITAWVIPSVEIIISIALIFRRTRLIALYGSLGLMVMFTTYIIMILQFSQHIPCACGGVLSNLSWKEHLVFNVAFLLLAIVGIVLQRKLSMGSLTTQF